MGVLEGLFRSLDYSSSATLRCWVRVQGLRVQGLGNFLFLTKPQNSPVVHKNPGHSYVQTWRYTWRAGTSQTQRVQVPNN